MKKVLLDTDILLDYFQARMPFGIDALKVISMVMSGELIGFVTPVILANCHYLLRKTAGSEQAREKVLDLLRFLKVIGMDKAVCMLALQSPFTDFEDALQHEAALQSGQVDVIITRNLKDYTRAKLPVMTPKMFFNAVSYSNAIDCKKG